MENVRQAALDRIDQFELEATALKPAEQNALDKIDILDPPHTILDADSKSEKYEFTKPGKPAQAMEVKSSLIGSLKDRIIESAFFYRLSNRNFYLMLAIDTAIFTAVHIFAYLIRLIKF